MRIVQAASGTTSSIPTFAFAGMPEGEEEEQEIGNLFKKK